MKPPSFLFLIRQEFTRVPVRRSPWRASRRLALALVFTFACSARGQVGGGGGAPTAADATPTVDTDVSTTIKTGSGYDAWTGSAIRTVTDLEVPGAVSEHGLKWTRTYNSSTGQWSFAYTWRYEGRGYGNLMYYPDGRIGIGIRDRVFGKQLGGYKQLGPNVDVWLEDGSDINMASWSELISPIHQSPYVVDHITPQCIYDRYKRKTTLEWDQIQDPNNPNNPNNPDAIHLVKITDPSGRYISIKYGNINQTVPTEVDGSDGSWVKYTWQTVLYNGQPWFQILTEADYSDGTKAVYTYNQTTFGLQGNNRIESLITASDTRADCPMQAIKYDYASNGNAGQVTVEHHLLRTCLCPPSSAIRLPRPARARSTWRRAAIIPPPCAISVFSSPASRRWSVTRRISTGCRKSSLTVVST